MFELFTTMVKEEWRVHSTMFGSLSFALFPVMIFGIAFMGSFLIPLMRTTLPAGNLTLIIHANYLMLGIMVGGFGLLGNEVMNRRFGQASLLAYSARSLPLSEKFIFLNFVIKDTVYYFFLWVLPFGFGYILASPFTGVPLAGCPAPAPHPDALVPLWPLRRLLPLGSLCPLTTGTLARPAGPWCGSGRPCRHDWHEPGALFPAAAPQ